MKRVLLFAILFATTTTGNTEPTPAVRYLMNEPVTLFDLGMLRLEQLFGSFTVGSFTVPVHVTYQWKENRIAIDVFLTSNMEAKSVQKVRCKEVITGIKNILMVKAQTGKPFSFSHSLLPELFSHVGFTSTDKPKNVAAELDTITEVSVRVFNVMCKSALLSKEILFTQ